MFTPGFFYYPAQKQVVFIIPGQEIIPDVHADRIVRKEETVVKRNDFTLPGQEHIPEERAAGMVANIIPL